MANKIGTAFMSWFKMRSKAVQVTLGLIAVTLVFLMSLNVGYSIINSAGVGSSSAGTSIAVLEMMMGTLTVLASLIGALAAIIWREYAKAGRSTSEF